MIIIPFGAIVFAILFYASSKEVIPEDEELHKLEIPFYRMAAWIVHTVFKKNGKEAWQEIQKWKLAITILFLGFVILPILDYATTRKEVPIVDYTLERPQEGEGMIEYHIEAQQEEETEKITVSLEKRKLTDKEKRSYLEKARQEIDQIVLGENESTDEVRGKVNLPGTLQDGKVTVYWIQEPQGLLESDGTIIEDIPEEGNILILQALCNCEGMEESYEFALHLLPKIRSEEEQYAYELRKAVEKAMDESSQENKMVLPRQLNGKNLTWIIPGNSMTEICILGILFLAVLGYVGKDQEFRKEEEEKERQLIMDYPDVVFKLGMLLNAGLTIQNAFSKIAEEYKEHGGEKRFVYEEMLYACNEMNSGISEARAYENFGRRCRQSCYVRLGTTLAGGLQKSAEGITNILLKEADQSMEDRRLLARKMGEEAGTKLMFPMILMLMVVMVILMVPAMISF